jgi:hypothetical protein
MHATFAIASTSSQVHRQRLFRALRGEESQCNTVFIPPNKQLYYLQEEEWQLSLSRKVEQACSYSHLVG